MKILTGLLLCLLINCQAQNKNTSSYGPYFGQEPPGNVVELFAPGVISGESDEVNAVFNPEGNEFYFSLFRPGKGYTIMTSRETSSGWSKPEVASFSGNYSEVDMFITTDGQQMFYVSKRPLTKEGQPSAGYKIWVMNRIGEEWGIPHPLGDKVNSGRRQLYPTLTSNKTLYFGSNREGFGGSDIFRSYLKEGVYSTPENLGNSINTEYDETDVFIAPDESYMIFTSVKRPDGFGSGDNYISFQNTDGTWTTAQNLGGKFNTSSSEFCPMISPEGKYFFFTSGRRGSDDIYWIEADFIKEYKIGEK